MSRWDSSSYMRMTRVEARPAGQLAILFADGSTVCVDGQRLVPAGARAARWEKAKLGETGFELIIPVEDDNPLYIPWDTIRTVTDSDFAAHMGRAAEIQARSVGTRIRELREARKLTAREVAERAGITPQSMYRIEHGKHDVVLTTLGKILAAMGYSYGDLMADHQDGEE